jgi:carboxylesterase
MDTTARSPVRGDPSPFMLEGGPVGLLMVHGFTGSPAELRPVANELHRRGLTIHAPLLPGHGTMPEDCNRCKLEDWTRCVSEAYETMRARCDTVFVAGLSLGSLLALHFAARRPGLPGIILYALPLGTTDRREKLIPFARFFIKSFSKGEPNAFDAAEMANTWDYPVWPLHASHEALRLVRAARRMMPEVSCPVLMISSAEDDFVRSSGPQEALASLGSTDKALVMLRDCGHVITAGAGASEAAEKTHQFIAARSPV